MSSNHQCRLRRCCQNGFTLIEMIVVVAIIAAVSIIVSFNLSGNLDRKLKIDAERFVAVINNARDEAIITGDNFALLVDEDDNSYRLVAMRAASSLTANEELFKRRQITSEIDIEWSVFDTVDDEDAIPKAVLTSMGEITPFELRLEGDQLRQNIIVNEQGELEIVIANPTF